MRNLKCITINIKSDSHVVPKYHISIDYRLLLIEIKEVFDQLTYDHQKTKWHIENNSGSTPKMFLRNIFNVFVKIHQSRYESVLRAKNKMKYILELTTSITSNANTDEYYFGHNVTYVFKE